jgi:hypothetical protein
MQRRSLSPKESGLPGVATKRSRQGAEVKMPGHSLKRDGLTAVLQLLYPENHIAKWLFPQEKATFDKACKGTRIGEPL